MSDTFLPGNGFDTYEEQDKVLVGLGSGRGCRAAVRILQQQGFAVTGAVVRLSAEDDTAAAAKEAADFPSCVDPDDNRFLAPASMIEEVRAACADTHQPVPAATGEVMQCVYNSLTQDYRRAVETLQSLTGKTYTSLNIVGGGSQDGYLNQQTANATGLTVFAGPTEGTALGNLMVQFIHSGDFADLSEARAAIRARFACPAADVHFLVGGTIANTTVIAAALVSGNAILFSSRSQIKGLTTSTGLWACSILGFAIGAGLYTVTGIVFLFFLCILACFPAFEQYLKNRSNHFEIHLELKNKSDLPDFVSTVRALGIRIDDIESNPAYLNSGLSVFTVSFTVASAELKQYKKHGEIIEALRSLDYVYYIEEMN